MSYQIFARNWYKADGETPDYEAPKKVIRHNIGTEEEARKLCNKWNAERPESWHKRSRKFEFTSA